ncbi:MAG: succinyl-CoA synthetase beta subunit, partial [Bacteroidia bacterium]
MNIHEYQAKEILQGYGVAIQQGIVADNAVKATEAAKQLNQDTGTEWFVIKAQIHAGGRGKGIVNETGSNGVVLAKSLAEVGEKAEKILNGTLVTHQTGPEGKVVNKVLIAQDVYYPGASEPKEYYLSILLDRARGCNVIMASTEGGMDIETVADETPEKIIKEWIDPSVGLQGFQARKVAFGLGLEGEALKNMVKFIYALYKAYLGTDSSMFEINPVLKTS